MLYAHLGHHGSLLVMSRKTRQMIEKTLRQSANDPLRFAELMDTWNDLFATQADERSEMPLDVVEDMIQSSFAVIADESNLDVIGSRLIQAINKLPHSALVVRADGIITAMNETALERLTLDPGDRIDQIGDALDQAESLSQVVGQSLDRHSSAGEVKFCRAVLTATSRPATLAIVPSPPFDGTGNAVIFVIDPVWRAEVETLLSTVYGLTEAEAEITMAFVDGYSLKEIAQQRGRSHATVRTQFQTIMAKAGASTQAELMRNTVAVSQFFIDLEPVTEVARHPYRKKFDLFRPGGRSVDVTLCGDLSGDLVIYIPDMTQVTFQASIEAAFRGAGLCVASLCRPGFGRTDPPPQGMLYEECLAQDIAAFQDQYGVNASALMAHNTSTSFAFRMGSLIPQRIRRIVLLSTLVPSPFLKAANVRSPWVSALVRTTHSAPTLQRTVVAAAIRSWKVIGSRRMFAMQLASYKPDVALASQPDSVAEHDHAVTTALAQGLDYAMIVFEHAMRDWSDWVSECAVPVEIIQGAHDPVAAADVVHSFVEAFPDNLTLHTLDDAGYMVLLSHTNFVVECLAAAARD